jgi:hypothetical protein
MLARIHERLFIQITNAKREKSHIYIRSEKKERERENKEEDSPLTIVHNAS